MDKKTVTVDVKQRMKKVFATLTTALAILVGIGYIVAACHLYFTGGADPYSRERVGEYLKYLSIPSIVLILSVIATAIASIGETEGRLIVDFDSVYLLKRARKRTPTHRLDKHTQSIAMAEQKKRTVYVSVTAALTAALLTAAAVIALDSTQYKNENLTAEVVGVLTFILPLCAVALIILTVCAYLFAKSCEIELDAHMLAIQEKRFDDDPEPPKSILVRIGEFINDKNKAIILSVRICIALAACALIVFGVLNGGMADVLAKAVKICTECIGLG